VAPLTRRTFLVTSAAGVAWAATPGWARRRDPLISGGSFPTGIVAGLPGMHGASFWTRVGGIERSGLLTLEIAADPDMHRVLHRERVRATAIRDFTAQRRVSLPGRLRPGEDYWYRFTTRDRASAIGRFRTRRPPDSREPVRVGFFSCQGWEAGFYTAHAGLAREPDLDLVVSLGDYIYEETDDVGPRRDQTGANHDGNAQTLADYREKYRLYRSDPDLQAMHAAHAFAHIPDDHDIESGYHAPGYGDDGEGETQGFPRRVPFAERKRAALIALFENMPGPWIAGERDRLFRAIPLGGQAEVFLTDLHRYAHPYPCRGGPKLGPIALGPCDERWDPRRSLLGARQKAWLKAGLARSRASWKIWGSTLMMEALEYAPGLPFNLGQWDGYAAERRELMEFLLSERIGDVAVVSGDIHTFFAGRVTTTGTFDQPTGAVEFVGGSISSEGIPDTIADERYKDQLGAFTDNVRDLNPHMSFADTRHRGYCVFTCDRNQLTVDFRAPRTALEPQSEMLTIAKFRVPRGANRIEQIA
jgi:alkaline phosphatase D